MEKGIRMEPLYKGRGDIVSPANIDKGLFTRHPHAPQTSKEKRCAADESKREIDLYSLDAPMWPQSPLLQFTCEKTSKRK
jgi:hypothetical protein